jgi:hypothetical protein
MSLLKHAADSLKIIRQRIETFIRIRLTDAGRMKAQWEITKFASEEDRLTNKKYTNEEAVALFGTPQIVSFKPNLLLNEGIEEMWKLVATTGATKFDNTNAYLAVGDSSTAEAATQTDLQASTNKLYKAMDATYPQVSTTACAWKSTFASADANFAWNEFSVANGSSGSAKNLNRKVSNQGQ